MLDDLVPAVLRLGELQQQGQALLLHNQDSGGHEGRQQGGHIRVGHKQALVFLCRTQVLICLELPCRH